MRGAWNGLLGGEKKAWGGAGTSPATGEPVAWDLGKRPTPAACGGRTAASVHWHTQALQSLHPTAVAIAGLGSAEGSMAHRRRARTARQTQEANALFTTTVITTKGLV